MLRTKTSVNNQLTSITFKYQAETLLTLRCLPTINFLQTFYLLFVKIFISFCNDKMLYNTRNF